MFFGLYNYFKQLPLLARIIFGLALGAVFIFFLYFTLWNYFSVPLEADYFPSGCQIFLKVNNNDQSSKLASEIVDNYNLININNIRSLSICGLADGKNLIFVRSKDKSIEQSFLQNGFNFKKIGKGKYLISQSPELLAGKYGFKLSRILFGKYRHGDIYIYSSKNYLRNSDFKGLDYLCSSQQCFLKGVRNGNSIIFADYRSKIVKDNTDYLQNFDFVYGKVNSGVMCGEKINNVLQIETPLWVSLLGSDNIENYSCNDYVLALTKKDISSTDYIWQGYKVLASINFKQELSEESIKEIEGNLKKSVATLFPLVETVELNDGTVVKEEKINPDKISFQSTSTYHYLDFPDGSASIYYKNQGNNLKFTNNADLFSQSLLMSGYFAAKTSLVSGVYGKYILAFEKLTFKNNQIILK